MGPKKASPFLLADNSAAGEVSMKRTFGIRRPCLLALLLGLAAVVGLSSKAVAQAAKKSAKASQEQLEEYQKGSKRVDLESIDGVYLTANYWAAPKAGHDTPAIILLHERGRKQLDLFPFAKRLNDDGFAVITFDFRGHGDSQQINPDKYLSPREVAAAEAAKEAEATKRSFTKRDEKEPPRKRPRSKGDKIDQAQEFRSGRDLSFLINDIEAVKQYLVKENNAGRLNIKRLGVVALGDAACHIALQFAELEYEGGGRAGWYRQGRDLGALVLVSPTRGYQGVQAATEFGNGGNEMPILLVSSEAPRSESEASRLARGLHVPESRESARRTDRPESLWLKITNKGSGTELLRPPVADLDSTIHGFLKGRLTGKRGSAWEQRELDSTREAPIFGAQRSARAEKTSKSTKREKAKDKRDVEK
jgi:pimeloyl-ACP methyl ester carboxylesterase